MEQKSFNLHDMMAERVSFNDDLVLHELINQFALLKFCFLEVRNQFGGFEDTAN